MNTKNTVFSRLFDADKHRELKLKEEKKVELSIVDDLENLYDDLNSAYEEAIYYSEGRLDDLADEFVNITTPIKNEIDEMAINGNVRFLVETAENVQSLITDLKQKADDLGIDPRELVTNYDALNEMSLSAGMVYDELIAKYRETISYTGNNDFLR